MYSLGYEKGFCCVPNYNEKGFFDNIKLWIVQCFLNNTSYTEVLVWAKFVYMTWLLVINKASLL